MVWFRSKSHNINITWKLSWIFIQSFVIISSHFCSWIYNWVRSALCSTLSSLICSSAVIHTLFQPNITVKECFPKPEKGLVTSREIDSATQHYNRGIKRRFLHISRSESPQEYTGHCTTITVNIFICPFSKYSQEQQHRQVPDWKFK